MRSAAVNSQLNGLAVVLYRVMKASRVCFSLARLAKSLGVTAFFWMMEKKISINRPSGACTGVWITRARLTGPVSASSVQDRWQRAAQ